MINFLHMCNGVMIMIIFLLRLYYAFENSIYAYPVGVYECILGMSIFDFVCGILGMGIYGINRILSIIKYKQIDRSYDEWHINFIPQIIPSILIPFAMILCLAICIILVFLLIREMKLV